MVQDFVYQTDCWWLKFDNHDWKEMPLKDNMKPENGIQEGIRFGKHHLFLLVSRGETPFKGYVTSNSRKTSGLGNPGTCCKCSNLMLSPFVLPKQALTLIHLVILVGCWGLLLYGRYKMSSLLNRLPWDLFSCLTCFSCKCWKSASVFWNGSLKPEKINHCNVPSIRSPMSIGAKQPSHNGRLTSFYNWSIHKRKLRDKWDNPVSVKIQSFPDRITVQWGSNGFNLIP